MKPESTTVFEILIPSSSSIFFILEAFFTFCNLSEGLKQHRTSRDCNYFQECKKKLKSETHMHSSMEGIYCRTSSTSSSSTEIPKRKRQHAQDKPYRGIRMRKWGKWVAKIWETNKRSRIWLDSYSSPVAAVRAYNTVVFHLRSPSTRLNFPECIIEYAAGAEHDLSAAAIRKKATEVGTMVALCRSMV
ncbi:hypothetical protein ACS0TY_021686 [Phlomoides rotata]